MKSLRGSGRLILIIFFVFNCILYMCMFCVNVCCIYEGVCVYISPKCNLLFSLKKFYSVWWFFLVGLTVQHVKKAQREQSKCLQLLRWTLSSLFKGWCLISSSVGTFLKLWLSWADWHVAHWHTLLVTVLETLVLASFKYKSLGGPVPCNYIQFF